ncbi:MAG: hypothetical protein N839_0012055 [Desulfofustis sp. PB-SRB1]|nr:hypothetical protein [Desulfofustis sp. PB-SRB1]
MAGILPECKQEPKGDDDEKIPFVGGRYTTVTDWRLLGATTGWNKTAGSIDAARRYIHHRWLWRSYPLHFAHPG